MKKQNIELKVKGLKCDNPNCDYINSDIKIEAILEMNGTGKVKITNKDE